MPLHDRVVIERNDAVEDIPDTTQENPQQGKVIAIGPGSPRRDRQARRTTILNVSEQSLRAREAEARCDHAIGMMHADQMRLRQALLNLMSNANKFTEKGTVTIAAHQG